MAAAPGLEEPNTMESDDLPAQETSGNKPYDKPICLIVLGMAGSGKTAFVQRLTSFLHSKKTPPYVINLDPAVKEVPFPANIDIRDTVKYKEVMKQYGLGPNGGIVTSLNLFSMAFDQVLSIIEKRCNPKDKSAPKYVVIDTPGQIEVFTWSASGTIISESIAASMATAIVYIVDTARNVNPVTFMSNMLYACSILYKMKLPFIIVFNKADIINPSFAFEWMKDFETFQEALNDDTSYVSNLTRSMSLVLDEFYSHLSPVAVSSLTGTGLNDFLAAANKCGFEYEREFLPMYEKMKEKRESARKKENMDRVKNDISDDIEATMANVRTVTLAPNNDDEDDSEAEIENADADERKEGKSFERFVKAKPSVN
ncbi:DgyrCDS11210 [Dimorphilus gyrociliatus]|uniref:GPN-loop GTPase n=1 Tax=Dimorphilus gyrociliatus TaxID=2664684 RepID=A0A7I8W3Y0_9ANNE|nr:DgyrCDS11210 [Dimorphilus gyrociliatus]